MSRIEELRAASYGEWLTPRQTQELFAHLDALTAELDLLKWRQTWDDRDMTGMSCELVSARNERDKLAAELAAVKAERDGLRAACEAVVKYHDMIDDTIAPQDWPHMLQSALLKCKSALAASARGEGEK